MTKQLKTSYENNWKCIPLLGEVSRGTFIDSCLYVTGKNESHSHSLFKIDLIAYAQIVAQDLLIMVGKLKDTAEYSYKQLHGGMMG